MDRHLPFVEAVAIQTHLVSALARRVEQCFLAPSIEDPACHGPKVSCVFLCTGLPGKRENKGTHCCPIALFACIECSFVTRCEGGAVDLALFPPLRAKFPSLDALLSNRSCVHLPSEVSFADFAHGRQRFSPAVLQPLYEYFGRLKSQMLVTNTASKRLGCY